MQQNPGFKMSTNNNDKMKKQQNAPTNTNQLSNVAKDIKTNAQTPQHNQSNRLR